MEIRFHEELYDGAAIDEAAALYGSYATLAVTREPGGWIVKIEAQDGGADAQVIAAELANYALGRSIERSRATSPAGAAPDAAKEAA
jgi:hypothetical protein